MMMMMIMMMMMLLMTALLIMAAEMAMVMATMAHDSDQRGNGIFAGGCQIGNHRRDRDHEQPEPRILSKHRLMATMDDYGYDDAGLGVVTMLLMTTATEPLFCCNLSSSMSVASNKGTARP